MWVIKLEWAANDDCRAMQAPAPCISVIKYASNKRSQPASIINIWAWWVEMTLRNSKLADWRCWQFYTTQTPTPPWCVRFYFTHCLLQQITLRRSSSNDRIGLTLCYGETEEDVYIGKIEADSVAGRNGRIQEWDQIMKVGISCRIGFHRAMSMF